MESSGIEPFFPSLPDGAVVTSWIGIVHFVNADGNMARGLSTGGEAQVSTTLGLLVMVMYDLLTEGADD
jgi:hypothetical protein